jgi:putative selenate reductase
MEKPFRTAPLEMLAGWIFHELDARDSVLGIPKANLEIPSPRMAARMFGHTVAAPLGVAAGPHTQLAQNIVASWLCGARFIELKTVQILDEIEVSRPCIDSASGPRSSSWRSRSRNTSTPGCCCTPSPTGWGSRTPAPTST